MKVRAVVLDMDGLMLDTEPLYQIAWRVSANGKLRKKNQASAGRACLPGKLNHLGSVAREVPHGGVDLAQGNLHNNSVSHEPSALRQIMGG